MSMTPDALLAADTKTLYNWYGEELYEEDGFTQVHEDEAGGKHDLTSCWVVFKHEESGRYIQLGFDRSYSDGLQDYSFDASEVYPHTVTTIEYKGTPQAS